LDSINSYYYTTGAGRANDVKFVDRKDNTAIDFESFLNILIAQLRNQDFTNPVNDAEYMAQMAQLSILQQMQEVTRRSQQSYASSLLGKIVSVTRVSESGMTTEDTGYVDSVLLKGDELKIVVNGISYSLNEVTRVYDNGYYLVDQYNNGQAADGK
jgi:flagellar basal-body rod modification protein FlgD